MEYYYGGTMDDGAWYPYQEMVAVPQPDPYSTPKSKRSRKPSANVDLTSPSKTMANGSSDTPMSPGRRVNKIQKQLEYYFSTKNMNEDQYLRAVMDDEGWVTIETILTFKRMKHLGATKELVTEAAFHSTAIEVDSKNTERIRMDKMWKKFVGKKKKSSKKRSVESKARAKEKQRQKELDAAELNEETIEAIVAAIERKQERRERRRREREIQKEKAKRAERKEEMKDLEQGDDDLGDPNHDDMVNID